MSANSVTSWVLGGISHKVGVPRSSTVANFEAWSTRRVLYASQEGTLWVDTCWHYIRRARLPITAPDSFVAVIGKSCLPTDGSVEIFHTLIIRGPKLLSRRESLSSLVLTPHMYAMLLQCSQNLMQNC